MISGLNAFWRTGRWLHCSREARRMSTFVFRTPEHAELYSKFRPTPPLKLLQRIVSRASSADALLDVGCGSGQSTELLAEFFDRVVGTDVSAAQIAVAKARRDEKKLENVDYRLSSAEEMFFSSESFDVITASQCAHWFDLNKFYPEAHRVLRENGLLAMFGYCVPIPMVDEPKANEALKKRIMKHYREDMGPYWEANRGVIDSCFQTLAKPSRAFELVHQDLSIIQKWPTHLDSYIQYLATWSSYQKFRHENPDVDILAQLKSDLQNIYQRSTERDVNGDPKLNIDTNYFLLIYRKTSSK